MQLIKRSILLLTLCLSARSIWAETNQTAIAISEDLTKNLDGLATNLTTAITELETQIIQEKVKVKKKALNSGLVTLNQLNATTAKLQAELVEINKKLGATNTSQINATLTNLDAWEAEQLQRVNKSTDGVGLREARGLTTALIFSYTWKLKACKAGVDYPKSEYEYLLKVKIQLNQGYATKLINEMKLCGNTKRNSHRCQFGIEDAEAKVSNAPNDLRILVASGKTLTDSSNYGNICTNQLLTQLEKDKASVKELLDAIIEDNSSATESDEDSSVSTDSTESTGSSDSTESTGSSDSTESTASSDSTESTGSSDSTKSTGSSDSTESTGSSDSTGSTGSSDSTESTGSSDSTESKSSSDSTKSTGSSDSTESTGSSASTESTTSSG